VRKLACLAAAVVSFVTPAACGSSHRAQPYAGRLYSVAQVQRAFASLGLELHRGAERSPGLVFMLNDRRLGPQHLPSPPRVVTVVVATRRHAAESTAFIRKRPHTRVTRYANVAAFAKPYILGEVRAAVSALRWGTVPMKPGRRLIVPAHSIGPIRLGESRRNVEKAFGPGKSKRRGLVRYFGGRLLVNYWFHDGLYDHVEYLQTRWRGYHTRSGVHVGSSRQALRPLYVSCASKTECWLQAGPMPDAVGTTFTLRHGRVVDIEIGSFG
jgi:hypothetical protein